MDASVSHSSSKARGLRGRILAPVKAVLLQGITPDKVAWTLAVGVVCSILPFLGVTTIFVTLVGLCLRLNQPILQTVNQLLWPVQIFLILVYVRIGEWIWRAPHISLSISTMTGKFKESPTAFLAEFGWTGIHAATAWGITAPLIIGILYFALRPVARSFASKIVPAERRARN